MIPYIHKYRLFDSKLLVILPGTLVILPMGDKGRFFAEVGDGRLIDCNKVK